MPASTTVGTFVPIASTLGAMPSTSNNGYLFVSIPDYGSYQLYSTGPFSKNEPTPFSTLASTIGPNITGSGTWGA